MGIILMRGFEKAAGAALAALAISVQSANVLVCIALLVLGPAVVLRLFFQ